MRITGKGKGLLANLGLEDDTVIVPVEADPVELGEGEAVLSVDEDGIPTDTSETADAALVEVAEDGAELDQAVDVAEDLQADEVTLESIHVALKASLESGGLDKKAATMMQIAVEAICARWGMEAGLSIPSLESFGGTTSRTASTTIAVEAVGEAVAQFGVAVARQIAKIWEHLANFIEKIWVGASRTGKVAAAIAAQAKALEGKPGAEGAIKFASAGKLAIGTAVATAAQLNEGLKDIDRMLKEIVHADMAKALVGDAAAWRLGSVGEELAKLPGSGTIEGEVEVARLTPAEVVELCGLVVENCKTIDEFHKGWATRAQTKDALLKPIMAKGAEGKEELDAMHATIGKMTTEISQINGRALSIGKAVIEYAHASLKGEAPAAAPAAEPAAAEPAPAV